MKINGSLAFDASSASEILNLRVQKFANFAAVPAWSSSDAGRLVFAIDTGTLYYGTSAAWLALATGGNAAVLQTEVDAIETSLGAMINSSGVFVPGVVSGLAFTGAETSVTALLQALSAYATGNNTLAELDDVTLTTTNNKDALIYNGTTWVNRALVVSDLTGVTAAAAELNVLTGTLVSAVELNYVDGVTSSIQTQLNAKQALDAGLTALAVFNTNGILVQTANNVFDARTLAAPTKGFTINDPAGIAGNPTFVLANGLASLEALGTFGFVVQTAEDVFITRNIVTGSATNIVVTNGDGIGASPTIDLATVTNLNSGAFLKFARDIYGRVEGTLPVVAADIVSLVDGIYINAAGDTMSGDLDMGGRVVKSMALTPVNPGDATSKSYVDSLVVGLSWQAPVKGVVALAANLPTSGLTIGDRYLAFDTDRIYTATSATTFNTGVVPVDGWSVFDTSNETGYVYDGAIWVQFTGSGQITAGVGLLKTGNVLDVRLGAGITELGTDDFVSIDLFVPTSNALILTTDGSTRSTASGAQLQLLLDSVGGLAQSTSGLLIAANGVRNAMLQNSTFTIDADDTGTSTVALGGILAIFGDATAGVSTSIISGQYRVTVGNATVTQKGVASFAAADFDVTAGSVTIKNGGVDNIQLLNSTVTFTGTTGSDPFALGETVAIVGGASGEVSTNVTANQVAVSVRDATATLKGVASFAAADFTVTAGAVTSIAKNLDNLTDVVITTPIAGQTLVNNGTNFVNRPFYFLYNGYGDGLASGGANSPVASTTHSVAHNLGQSYCNVTVVDGTNNVVIPQSIVFTDANTLTVTFNTAILCRVVVMGVNLGV